MPSRPSAASGSGGRGRGSRQAGAVNKSTATTPARGGAASGRGRGRGRGGAAASAPRRDSSGTTSNATAIDKRTIETMEISDDEPEIDDHTMEDDEEDDDDGQDARQTIPPELLTRLLHEFFEGDTTRITKDANDAVAKYVDVFVREAIARTALEGSGGFLEVSLTGVFYFVWGFPLSRDCLLG